MSVLDGGIAEGAHAVTDCLDAGHRCAAAGKGAQQQPEGRSLRRGRLRRRHDRRWAPAGGDRLGNRAHQQPTEARNDDLRWNRKD